MPPAPALPNRTLAGKVAVITGSSRGLGRRIAEVVAAAGARVVLVARPREGEAARDFEDAAATIDAAGGEALAIRADVSADDEVRELARLIVDHFGGADILVNNAAMRLSTKLLDTPVEDFERIFRVNVLGPFLMWRHLVPVMVERGGGNVINLISTNAPVQPFIGMAPYRMSKAALTFLSADLAHELRESNVAVNAFDPGPVISEGTAAVRNDREQRYNVRIPYHAQDPVEVLDEPIVWLASQTAQSFTGNSVRRVDFGKTWGPGVTAGNTARMEGSPS